MNTSSSNNFIEKKKNFLFPYNKKRGKIDLCFAQKERVIGGKT